MNSDINSLSGIEFENFCRDLLQRYDFEVQTTKQSGDGGIDLVAYNHKPFLRGKYIIQCKRYTGGVGEPIIRDLYGVVMSERANKGILITTGYFSMPAMKFALDKNLELIDGDELNQLLRESNMISDEEIKSSYKSFVQYDCFDSKKYEFYKGMIAQNMCTVEMGRDFLFNFMYDYMKKTESENLEMLHAGFMDEYIRLFDWYANKYYKRGKEQKELIPHYKSQYRDLASLYNFDLFDYVQSRYNFLKKKNIIHIRYNLYNDYMRPMPMIKFHTLSTAVQKFIIENAGDTSKVDYATTTDLYEICNLLSLFSYFKIDKGVDYINKMLFGAVPELENWVRNTRVYSQSVNNFYSYYFQIRPIRFSKGSGGFKYDHIDILFKGIIDLKPFFDLYIDNHQEKVSEDIKKIEELLDTLI